MAYFATPGIGTGGTFAGWGSEEVTKSPEPVSAAPASFSFSSVLGRQIPIVIGTGKVDGIPVIGGSNNVTAISGYQPPVQREWGVSYPPGTKFGGGGTQAYTVEIPIYSTTQTSQIGYLLAYDPFGAGYKLVRLEVNDEVVFDAEKGISATTTYRFYGGNHTAVDPITSKTIGADAGAWQNFAMVYLDGFAASSPPTVKAVISNNATTTPDGGEIVWTGEAPSGVIDAFPHGSAYDPAEGVIYQILEPTDVPGLTQIWLAVLDVDSRQELYRVPLQGSEPYAYGPEGGDYQLSRPIPMPGTGMVMVQLWGLPATPRLSAIYDAATGHIVASSLDTANINWWTVQQFGQLWAFIGHNFDAGTGVTGIFDSAKGSFVVNPEGVPARYQVVAGRRTTGFCSFFTVDSHLGGAAEVYELRFDGDQWSNIQLLSLTGDFPTVSVLWFDPATNYLVILNNKPSDPNEFLYVNPDTGAVVDSFNIAASAGGFNVSFLLPVLHDRLISRPGYVLMLAATTFPHYDIRVLDIGNKSVSTFASGLTAEDATRMSYVIVDQTKASYITAIGEYAWTVHRQPNTLPGALPLETIVTKAMFLAGYAPEELTFEGLST
ncbi:hypothetical protein [Mesorhizobium sp.]|uniref:hypothetical protein n=1 Tax=Mesorhizobium sp. TaxID=1871066 RepID=UPI000FE36F53|nr:hypothetical protein [Mesorhizobium sp.]RWK33785.1 MAG: hypothetical protein EOR40_19755 [Mesorhizobium sp.]